MKRFIIENWFKLAVVGLLSCQLYYLAQPPTSGDVWVRGGSLAVDVNNPVDVRGTVRVGNEVGVYGTVDVGNVIGSVDVDVIDTVDVNGSVSVDNIVDVEVLGSVRTITPF